MKYKNVSSNYELKEKKIIHTCAFLTFEWLGGGSNSCKITIAFKLTENKHKTKNSH